MKSLDPLTEVAKWRISLARNHLDFSIPPELIERYNELALKDNLMVNSIQ